MFAIFAPTLAARAIAILRFARAYHTYPPRQITHYERHRHSHMRTVLICACKIIDIHVILSYNILGISGGVQIHVILHPKPVLLSNQITVNDVFPVKHDVFPFDGTDMFQ